MFHQKIVAKDESGQFFAITFNPPPDSLIINGKQFVFMRKGEILERIKPSSTNFFIGYESVNNYSQSNFHEVKENYITGSYSIIYMDGSNKELKTTITTEAKPILYYFNGKRHIKITDKKRLFSVLNDKNKKNASEYLNSKDISFNNVDDLYLLIAYTFGE